MTRFSRSTRRAGWLAATAVGLFSLVGLVAVSHADRHGADALMRANFKITGTVLDSAGKPVAETSVRLLKKEDMVKSRTPMAPGQSPTGDVSVGIPEPDQLQKGGGGRGERIVKQAKTDSAGKFIFTDVPPGKYAIMAGIGKTTSREEFEISNADPAPITLKLSGD